MSASKWLHVAFLLAIAFAFPATGRCQKHSYVPKQGFVPDARTAIRIAEAVWEPIYGKDDLRRHRPTRARLIDGVWHVRGSMPKLLGAIRGTGGVAVAELDARDGRVLRVSHGK